MVRGRVYDDCLLRGLGHVLGVGGVDERVVLPCCCCWHRLRLLSLSLSLPEYNDTMKG